MAMTRYASERRMLQVAVFLAACVPVVSGAVGMVSGISVFEPVGDVSLDNHFRYLSGLLCGLGLNFWMMIPKIETHGIVVLALTLLVVLGGLARLLSAVFVALPSPAMQWAIGMELVVTPLLCIWQARIARMAR